MGGDHVCALPGDGTVLCWGGNTFGQLGKGSITDPNAPAGDVELQQIVIAGAASATGGGCVDVVADGSVVRCRGSASLSGVTAIAAGFTHTCALLVDATVKCWGSNAAVDGGQFGVSQSGGELGDGTTVPRPAPVAVVAGPNETAPLSDVRALSAANRYTCAVLADGSARCWGDTPQGASLAPVAVMADATHPLMRIQSISAGYTSACALLADHSVVCWGSGLLGNQSDAPSTRPVAVTVAGSPPVALGGITAISLGHNIDLGLNGIGKGHSCALAQDRTVSCWGLNDVSQLGNGNATQSENGQNWAGRVVAAAGTTAPLSGVTAIAAGGAFTCALLADGTVRCWGLSFGAPNTGIGAPVVATQASGKPLSNVVAIAAGGQYCALIRDRSIECSGGEMSLPGKVPGLVVAAPKATPAPTPTPRPTATPPTASTPTPATSDVDGLAGDWHVTFQTPSMVAIAFAGGNYSIVAKSRVGVIGGSCYLAPGTLLATFAGTGGVYAGQHGLWRSSNCTFDHWTPMTARLDGNRLTAQLVGWGRVVFTRVVAVGAPAAIPFRESVPTPAKISSDPIIAIESIALALAFVIFIPFPGALFDSTLEANYAEIMGWGRSARRRLRRLGTPIRALARAIRRNPPAPRPLASPGHAESGAGAASVIEERADVAGGEGWRTPSRIAVALLLSVLLGCLLDPTFGLDIVSVATFIGVLGGLVVTLLVFGVPRAIAYLSNRKAAGAMSSSEGATDGRRNWDPYIRALPAAMAVGVACVLISRLTDFQPGYLYGLIIGVTARNELTDHQAARTATAATIVMLVVACLAWFGLGWIAGLAPAPGGAELAVIALQTALATVMVAGLQGALFGLLPMRFFDGGRIKTWNRWVWGGLFLIAFVGFWHVLVNPSSGYLADSSRTPLLTIIGLLVFFGLGSVAFWAYFRYRRRPAVAAAIP